MSSGTDHLQGLHNWQPFRIDALGLITMLGAEQLNRAIGRLVRNQFFEYLPLLCAFVIASDQITEPVAGFTLFNITDSIVTTEVSGWFARWMLSQKLRRAGTKLEWIVLEKPRSVWREECISLALGILLPTPLLILAVLMADWFGLANSIAMLISVVTRWYIVAENREMLDRDAAEGDASEGMQSKLLCVLPDGKAVTMYASRGLVRKCFTRNPTPAHPRIYLYMRMLGWVGFAVQIISIGMSVLVTQIYTVILVVLASILMVYGVGSDDNQIGRRLCVQRDESWESNPNDNRRNLYADLNLSETEELLLLEWNLFPKKTNETWWKNYREFCESSKKKDTDLSNKTRHLLVTEKRSEDPV